MKRAIIALQLPSATMQLSDAMFGCQITSIFDGRHILRCASEVIFSWLPSIGADVMFLALFCAGFWLFGSMKSSIWSASQWSRICTKISANDAPRVARSLKDASDKFSDGDTVTTKDQPGDVSIESQVRSGDGSPAKDVVPEPETCRIRPRRDRFPVLQAQTAGQAPELPEDCTSVIVKNIPKHCTPETLLTRIHECGYFGEVDFIYVPIDFKKGDRSFGFAILNFSSFDACFKFAAEFHMADACDMMLGKKARKFIEISPAGVQGCQENVRRLQSSPVLIHLAQYPDWLPRRVDGGGLATPLKPQRVGKPHRRLPPDRAAA